MLIDVSGVPDGLFALISTGMRTLAPVSIDCILASAMVIPFELICRSPITVEVGVSGGGIFGGAEGVLLE